MTNKMEVLPTKMETSAPKNWGFNQPISMDYDGLDGFLFPSESQTATTNEATIRWVIDDQSSSLATTTGCFIGVRTAVLMRFLLSPEVVNDSLHESPPSLGGQNPAVEKCSSTAQMFVDVCCSFW